MEPPPPPPPHLCNNTVTHITSTPSRLKRLSRKASEKWFNPLRLATKRNSEQYLRHKQSITTISPYSNGNKWKDPSSPTPSSSSHLPIRKSTPANDIRRSKSFAYGHQQPYSPTITPLNTTITTPTIMPPIIYPALLSRVAYEFQRNMIITDHYKNGIEYKNSFTGQEAVDLLARVISTNDRFLALMIGRALGSQRFFHDVGYENRLMDSAEELYQLEEHDFINKSNKNTYGNNTVSFLNHSGDSQLDYCGSPTTVASHDATILSINVNVNDLSTQHTDHLARLGQHTVAFPNAVITELTWCYSSTCQGNTPCYSYTCPKRQSNKHHVIAGHYNQLLNPQKHPLWSDLVSESEYSSISPKERKRQESIYELIYTEANYVKDLEYLDEMWIQPLVQTDIIPESRRADFIDTVFSNISSIYAINVRLATALLARQKERLVVNAIGDIMLDFVVDFDPYIKYGARQHEAKYALEYERQINATFDWFNNDTERHPASYKLELNGYLTKPTTRMGKYLLLLQEILKRTPDGHPDCTDIPKAIDIIKQFLTRVNTQAGRMKNRFDLERLHDNLIFKHKADMVDLGLLNDSRVIIKQGTLRKTQNRDSTEYQVILLDHYLVVVKVKLGRGNVLKYVIQDRPMALDLLTVYVPTEQKEQSPVSNYKKRTSVSNTDSSDNNDGPDDDTCSNTMDPQAYKRPSSIVPYVNLNMPNSPMVLRPFNDLSQQSNNNNSGDMSLPLNMASTTILHDRDRKNGYPIVFDYLGRHSHGDPLILYATSDAIRKPWIDKIIKQQMERQQRNKPIFETLPAVEPGHFGLTSRINHIITFNDGRQYILASDDGVYVGHNSGGKKPHKILDLPKVTQIQVVEVAEMLLVLSDKTLWEYGLDVVNGKPESQPLGTRVQTHVPFFHVGQSLQRTVVCIPRVSTLNSTITTFEPLLAAGKDTGQKNNNGKSDGNVNGRSGNPLHNKRHSDGNMGISGKRISVGILDKVASRVGYQQQQRGQIGARLQRLKVFYVPCEIWTIDLSPSKMLITSPRGMIMLDMKTDKPQQLLDPDDKQLTFVTDREREESSHIRQPLKHIAIFRTSRGDHFVCYDEYGFYIDGKGNRLYPNFLVEWEGNPEAFAYQYPYVIAFSPSFIEIRHIITGELEQIIRGSHIKCLNNGHKTEAPLIFGVMSDELQKQLFLFQLKRTAIDQSAPPPSLPSIQQITFSLHPT
ncbi:hypothetical protein BC941DRAFT_417893 [Chlamydoabsidia padenii]|nr:hypothetical protein BC941DRAFT_417893 [Chlamydoabsidia padenii]